MKTEENKKDVQTDVPPKKDWSKPKIATILSVNRTEGGVINGTTEVGGTYHPPAS